MKKVLIIGLAVLGLVSCGGRAPKAKGAKDTGKAKVELQVPVPPAMMEDRQERVEYVLQHYWDNYKPEVDSVSLEQAFSNWCALTEYAERRQAEKSLINGYDKAPERILALAERYLYDPNSPYRDEDFYGALAAHIGTPEMTELAKLCALNAVGTKAADFVYEDARGKRHRLYDTKAQYTVLFFSNPGCTACKEIIDQLALLAGPIEAGVVAVVNIYIDEDIDAWRDYLPAYPKTWNTGFDPLLILRKDNVYHIRAIPSVYLLAADKTVILKDAPTERMLQYLEINL